MKDFLNSTDEDTDHEAQETIADDDSLSAAIAYEVSRISTSNLIKIIKVQSNNGCWSNEKNFIPKKSNYAHPIIMKIVALGNAISATGTNM